MSGNAAQPVLTASELRAAEQRLIEAGIGVGELMRRAGTGAAEWIWRIAAGRSVTVLCGPGNNGGDGYVIAETLRRRGIDVTVVAPLPPQTDAAREACAGYKGPVTGQRSGSVFVDCLFGTGLSRPINDELQALLKKLMAMHDYGISVDLPSGVDSDSGRLLNAHPPRYDLTLALGAWKRAHWLMPGMAVMGERRLVDIGLDEPGHVTALSPRPQLHPPPADAHKYTRGLVAVIGGTMISAAVLASEAAMRAGAGYVKLLAGASHPAAPADLVMEHGEAAAGLRDERIAAVLVGPGLGRSDEAEKRLRTALASGHPLVLDADALVLLRRGDCAERDEPLVLTPHEGEVARLCAAFEVGETCKVAQAEALAKATGAVVLAKGPDTILTDGDRVRFFPPASSWLSMAGTGDVLAGIVASRLAVTGDPFRAAEEAVWLHGEAARQCGPALIAGLLARAVSDAYSKFL